MVEVLALPAARRGARRAPHAASASTARMLAGLPCFQPLLGGTLLAPSCKAAALRKATTQLPAQCEARRAHQGLPQRGAPLGPHDTDC